VKVTLRQHLQALGVELDSLLEQLGVPAYLVDASGTIRWQSEAAIALTGDTRGRAFLHFVAPEYRERSRMSFARQILGVDGVVEAVSAAVGADGSTRRVRVVRVPLKNGDDVVGIFGFARPINGAVRPSPPTRLTPREDETLRLLGKGLSTDEIAAELGVTRETARNYIRRLLRELGARSRLEAVIRAAERGLLPR
jgi:PAS domain S-box-containing protein